jgi:hypothetical protein
MTRLVSRGRPTIKRTPSGRTYLVGYAGVLELTNEVKKDPDDDGSGDWVFTCDSEGGRWRVNVVTGEGEELRFLPTPIFETVTR